MMTAGEAVLGGALDRSVYGRLEARDWTFSEASTREGAHGIHSYPAKFIPQIPRELIAALHPKDGTAVLDPFCGSGTSLVEAAAAGIPAVGIDLHPLACLISKVKTTPLSRSLGAAAEATADRASTFKGEPPEIPALDHWFKEDVQIALASLAHAIASEADRDLRDALHVAFSSIIVRVSNQESDTRYAAIDKEIRGTEVNDLFRRAARSIEQSLACTWPPLFPSPLVDVIHRDVLEVQPEDIPRPVSLVVTSPPYPNAYEYWLYHKYRMYWLGMDPLAVREKEIGARPNYFKRDPATPVDFERQMGEVFDLLSRVVIPDGHVCFQVGSSVIRGEVIDNAQILRRAAKTCGFSLVASMERQIPARRKSFNPMNSRIKREDILVFQLTSS